MKQIFISIIIFGALVTAKSLAALPVYKNYSNTNIFSTKFKLGYSTGNSKVQDYNFISNERNLDFVLEINPLYNFTILHNLYLALNANVAAGGNLRNNNLILLLTYNLPLNMPMPYWFPSISIFLGGGYGVRQTRVAVDSEFAIAKINKNSNITAFNLGLEVTPAQLKDYNIGFYLEAKSMISNYSVIEYGEKKARRYINNFVTIGMVYKINYLIK